MCGSCSHECGEKCSKIVLLEPKVVLQGPAAPISIPQFNTGISGLGITVSPLCTHVHGTVKSVTVANISGTHTRVGDLRFALVKDDIRVFLEETQCGTTEDFDFGFADDGLAQDASFCNPPSGPVGGGHIYKPDESLQAFQGIKVAGIWTLQIEDLGSGNTGELESWKLVIEYEY